jgi:hypothetical protein
VAATKKSGGFLGSIKSAFVDEIPDPVPAGGAPAASAPPPMGRISTVTPFPTIPTAPVPQSLVAPDPQATAKLEGMLTAALPPVYTAFMKQYEQLQDVIPNDGMRFKAALKTSGATPEQLATAVDQLLQTMQNAAAEFDKGFEANKANKLGQSQASIKATEDLIVSKEQQRKAIDEEILSLRNRLSTDSDHMQVEVQRLDGIRAGFMAAHAQILDRLSAQKAHIVSQPKL